MVMNAEELRAAGDWVAQLRTILVQGVALEGEYPASTHRSTKQAVKLLLSNLRQGVNNQAAQTKLPDIRKILFNAVDQLVREKTAESQKGKSRLDALAQFEPVLRQRFAAQLGRQDSLDVIWQERILEAIQGLRLEALLESGDQIRLRAYLDDLVRDKNVDNLATMINVRQTDTPHKPRALRIHCVRKLLESEQGQNRLTNNYVAHDAFLAVEDDLDLAEELLRLPINSAGFDNKGWTALVQSLGDEKNRILHDAILTILDRPLPPQQPARRTNATDRATAVAMIAKSLAPEQIDELATKILTSTGGRRVVIENPMLGGVLLSSISCDAFASIEPHLDFGDSTNDILAEALSLLSVKKLTTDPQHSRPPTTLDPQLFTRLANRLDPDVWNDKSATTGARKGLGARMCMNLWNKGSYDQICELISLGVNTKLATRIDKSDALSNEGVYSGWVQPIQHVLAKLLRDVHRLDSHDPPLNETERVKAEGAKKILKALRDREQVAPNSLEICTSWEEVTNSEMLLAFQEKPGTIWGFEDVRMPFVQAAHATDQGSRPLRMWELWDALETGPTSYEELQNDPNGYVTKRVTAAIASVRERYDRKRENNVEISHLDAFLQQYETVATGILHEFVQQLPKATYANVSAKAGLDPSKFLAGLACKAGLWWAKENNEPVYYCLDGVDMEDVVSYKHVKNSAIEEFLSGQTDKRHSEVITLVEIREILKNWNDLKDANGVPIVKFVRQGKLIRDTELFVDKWFNEMVGVNKAARTPAPNYTTFSDELNKIDRNLLSALSNEANNDLEKANQDARDIVKKHGYLTKIARTRPHIALKYIMSKCEVLTKAEYGPLISPDLPTAAKQFMKAFDNEQVDVIPGLTDALRDEILKCHSDFHEPLKAALLRNPETGEAL